MLSKGEIEQYRRHLSLQGFGETAQQKLKKGSVLMIGAGGLGCPALQYLTAAGVGKIGIVDDDNIDPSNLQRQILFNHQDIGKSKARIACEKLSHLNPHIQLVAHQERFSIKNAESLLNSYDLIVDGTDNFASRYLINDACVLFDRPLIHGSINQFEGMLSVFNYKKGPTYRCLFPEYPDPSSVPTCAEAGVLGVLPGIIGCWQALEAIKLLSGVGKVLSGTVLLYDALSQKINRFTLQASPDGRNVTSLQSPVESCGSTKRSTIQPEVIEEISEAELKRMIDLQPGLQILDVREKWERAELKISPSSHLALNELIEMVSLSVSLSFDPKRDLVVYCKAGVRSRMACQVLQRVGFSRLYNLANGMDGWSQRYPELSFSD
jgi:molybdopterin/thiamine biosynthesis adenylyltransferase/rhodanese-related sulfurtransferase